MKGRGGEYMSSYVEMNLDNEREKKRKRRKDRDPF